MDTFRPYLPADTDTCLDIFDSNTPRFFDPSERDKFARFLIDPVGSYFVVEREGEILACGGYLVLADPSMAELTWGHGVRKSTWQWPGPIPRSVPAGSYEAAPARKPRLHQHEPVGSRFLRWPGFFADPLET